MTKQSGNFMPAANPVLGICLGLQILLDHTEEGDKPCLGILAGTNERLDFADRSIKVPHIGWNEVAIRHAHPMLADIRTGDEFYFVHSYHARPENEQQVLGTTDYGDLDFCSILGQDNLFATQFHLEKSGESGLRLLAAFDRWSGQC